MKLSELGIKNYRSLEEVRLERLSKTNIIIGRNSSGKSSVFGALKILSAILLGQSLQPWERIITDRDNSRSLELQLIFTPTEAEREAFADKIIELGYLKETKQEIINSSLFRKIDFNYKSVAGQPDLLHLRTTKVLSTDNKWSTIQELQDNEISVNPMSHAVALEDIARDRYGDFSHQRLNLSTSQNITAVTLHVNQHTGYGDVLSQWPYKKLREFFQKSFFFDPFRHSLEELGVAATPFLDQDGGNLPTVLNTVLANSRPKFDEISKFMENALPDIGLLQTPLIGHNTQIGFLVPNRDYRTPLYDMGGGVEQLLMIATVLITTPEDYTLFLEEPESHLHAGAQRFLLERLTKGNRQVFINTHSPTFINSSNGKSLYQVSYSKGKSKIELVKDADSLENTLQDIGARNSDVLLSDAVFFVEGSGDKDSLTEIGRTVGRNFEEHNITLLPMNGGDFPERGLPVRSNLLQGISNKSPVPHLFLLDRDERIDENIKKVNKLLGEKIYFWKARELENYLLSPKALLEALKVKCATDGVLLPKIKNANEKDVNLLIKTSADKLYGLVLIKRIKNRIGGLKDGLLVRSELDGLIKKIQDKNLAELITQIITDRFSKHLQGLKIEKIVYEEQKKLDQKWAKPANRLLIAPGSEIIDYVFQHFGVKYNKPSDTVLIAKHLKVEDIPTEVIEVIDRTISLSKKNGL